MVSWAENNVGGGQVTQSQKFGFEEKFKRVPNRNFFFIRPTEIEAVEFEAEAEAEVRYQGLRNRSDHLNTQAFFALQKC